MPRPSNGRDPHIPVDRVRDVQQTPHGFDPPDDLDPVAKLEENLGSGWEFPTRAAVATLASRFAAALAEQSDR